MDRRHQDICLTNVRVNNLQNLNLSITKGQWLSVCGLSGCGKSSLAFDTLYAEGQRRYVECLSPKTRQFIQQLDPPDADELIGIPPSIAIRPTKAFSTKETVASVAELTNLLSLLFSKAATAVCPHCNQPATRFTKETIALAINKHSAGTKAQICFQLLASTESGSSVEELAILIQQAVQSGFIRAIVGPPENRRSVELEKLKSSATAEELIENGVWVVADRIIVGKTPDLRMSESIETALYYGNGSATVLISDEPSPTKPSPTKPSPTKPSPTTTVIDNRPWFTESFSLELVCQGCKHQFPKPRTQLFLPFNRASICPACGPGESQPTSRSAKQPRSSQTPCNVCQGTHFNLDARSFRFGDRSIDQWLAMNLTDASQALRGTAATDNGGDATRSIRKRLQARFDFLVKVGLGYLRLNRSLETLSTGERQRIRLTAVLASTLVNMLYVLDEPALGLHQHEIKSLRSCLADLHQRGNTLVVVDHNAELIQSAQRVIEIGPGAGAEGGRLVFDGTPQELLKPKASLTGEYIARRSGIACRSDQRRPPKSMMRLTGASGHNLKNVDVDFPLGCLCVLTGVSGSGKSSLLLDTLVVAVSARKGDAAVPALAFDEISGDGPIQEIVVVDQMPIGRTSRSNPVTYVKAFDDIRKAFAETADAQTHNLSAGHFSFNVSGGRCERCNGEGVQNIDMQFLADIHIRCSDCEGTRYRKEVLNVRYRDKNIAEVLDLTVREAFLFFRGQPRVQTKLKSLIDVGLEYIRLGQPTTTLSSGETQRLKLALYLNASSKKRVLFVMDEPTTGLHMKDVNRLIDCFDNLINAGHSVIAIEHNLQLIKNADYVIDLGPGAGDAGGNVVAFGPPEKVAACDASITGQYLKELLI